MSTPLIPIRTGTFKSFDGTEIYFEDRGSGQPIVLCYGLACLINHWTHQIKYFSQNYRVITFDYRGHHKSYTADSKSTVNLDTLVKDIYYLTQHLQLKPASFWGHSYGTQLLFRLYDQYPEVVSNLVLINGFAKNPIHGMFGAALGHDTLAKTFHAVKELYNRQPTAVEFLWKKAVGSPLAVPLAALGGGFNLNVSSIKDIEVYVRGVCSIDMEIFLKLFEEMMEYDASAILPNVDVPTLIIGGEKDGVTPSSFQYELKNQIKGSELLIVPYGSHCTQLDFPDFVNLKAEKFLNQNLFS